MDIISLRKEIAQSEKVQEHLKGAYRAIVVNPKHEMFGRVVYVKPSFGFPHYIYMENETQLWHIAKKDVFVYSPVNQGRFFKKGIIDSMNKKCEFVCNVI